MIGDAGSKCDTVSKFCHLFKSSTAEQKALNHLDLLCAPFCGIPKL